jgi:fermentation-respiration switch protein FrsA (DUF1100 family)
MAAAGQGASRRVMALLKGVLLALLVSYLTLFLLLYLAQRALMYFPEAVRTAPAAAGLRGVEEVTLATGDGERVIVWHAPPRGNGPVVLYFHGNGGALRLRAARFGALMAQGIGFVALSYRGYGGSTGHPSEAGLIADARAVYQFAATRYAPERLAPWGESLGTGVAVAVAAEHRVGRLVLEAPFPSALAVAAARYWYMPVRLALKDQFRSDLRIAKVTAPVLVIHGVRDRVIPIAFGERLYALIPGRKTFVRFPDGGHSDLDDHGALTTVGDFLAGRMDGRD